MKKLLFIFLLTIVFTFTVSAQTEQVCIDKETAAKCSKAFDEVVALREEVKAKTDALETLKAEIQRLQIQVAIQSTRATELEKQAVENRAVINAMIPALKKKKIGLINIF
jgi:TolA-binding protein